MTLDEHQNERSSIVSPATFGYGSVEEQFRTPPLVLASKPFLQKNGSISGREVSAAILPKFPDLLSAIPSYSHQALASIDGRMAVSHKRIHEFVLHIGHILHSRVRIGRGHRVAVVLPNGSELALAIVAVSCWASCVPLNAFAASDELQSDLEKAGVDCVIGLDPERTDDGTEIKKLATKLNLPFCGLVPDKKYAGIFELVAPHHSYTDPYRDWVLPRKSDIEGHFRFPGNNDVTELQKANNHDDEVLVLFTSGTTGSKKLVPHVLSDVIIATAVISVSWDLTPQDTNCNLMPLFHVGGIIRQVYSPILSGGCVICCPSFDPLIFWQLLMNKKNDNHPVFTWYYAAPTMHQLILQTGRAEGYIPEYDASKEGSLLGTVKDGVRLRMIANAAGGLLPSLARELRQAFGAFVLPSYGMTECMPISSPPSNYRLEKPGTSGVAVGPELAILNKETLERLEPGQEGPICVRHEPCFRGYGIILGNNTDGSIEKPSTFIPKSNGELSSWFDTGDLGYMDSDGYIFITGRSKEVINRGGEIISPMEVEEAVITHPDVQACAAISVAHAVLQEVVGLVLVMKPGRPRLDLPRLHEYLGDGRLAAAKWPQGLVYMIGGLPKSFTNKLLRVNLGKRLGIPELNDAMSPIERTFEAQCPPQGTDLKVPIPCTPVSCDPISVQTLLQQELVLNIEEQDLVVSTHPTKAGALVVYVRGINRSDVIEVAREKLDGYAMPTHICFLSEKKDLLDDFLLPPMPTDAVGAILLEQSDYEVPDDPVFSEVQTVMQAILNLDSLPPANVSFFNLGGGSMLASQLAAKIRKIFSVSFGGAEVFHNSTCQAIATLIHERRGDVTPVTTQDGKILDSTALAGSSLSKKLDALKVPFDESRLEVEAGLFSAIFQLLPICFIYPGWQLTRMFLFFHTLLFILNETPGPKNLMKFIATLVIFHCFWVTIAPLIFVLCKWLIIGKYKKGRYPLWGNYYLRWWIVDVLRKMIGRGSWGSNEQTLSLYYRMLGAKIGRNVRISSQADVAEYDLVTIDDDAVVELSTVRAFAIDNGCMILGPVGVGKCSSVGIRAVVAPYTSIPNNCHLAPATSSYELSTNADDDKHLRYNRQALPKPTVLSQIFVIAPVMLFVNTVSHLPALSVLFWMLHQPWNYDYPMQNIGHMMQWFCEPRRIPFFIGIRVVRSLVAPFFYMFAAILMKWCLIGKFKPGPRNTKSEWQLIRYALASQLFTRESIQQVTDIVGRHYELVSVLYRLLGAKIGKRVFWPGRQPLFTGEFELIEIGDDVVFGSRSTILCTTVSSSEKVIICAGGNVSDNTVVLPGSIIGKNAVLGSNAVCPEGRYLPEASVWFGVRGGEPVELDRGVEENEGPVYSHDVDMSNLQMIGDETTIRPFGRALYLGQASYFVYPLQFIIMFTIIIRTLAAVVSSSAIIGAVHGTAGYFYGWPISERDYYYIHVEFWSLYSVMISFYFLTHFLHTTLWLASELICKWVIIGQRREGRYNYNVSSYCQNWELYQITSKFRDLGLVSFLDLICGTPYMVSYFRLLGGKIGEGCCLYPTGGDPYMPEPDLVEIGDRCVIDCASVVCHLNTSGNFELVKITMENNVTLRTRARIQQGVYMESGSMLLEKCLALTGEVIDADSVWLGAPASRLKSYDSNTVSTTPSRDSSFSKSAEYRII